MRYSHFRVGIVDGELMQNLWLTKGTAFEKGGNTEMDAIPLSGSSWVTLGSVCISPGVLADVGNGAVDEAESVSLSLGQESVGTNGKRREVSHLAGCKVHGTWRFIFTGRMGGLTM